MPYIPRPGKYERKTRRFKSRQHHTAKFRRFAKELGTFGQSTSPTEVPHGSH